MRDIDPTNDLTFFRVRSKRQEILVAPDKNLFLIVIQTPYEEGEWQSKKLDYSSKTTTL